MDRFIYKSKIFPLIHRCVRLNSNKATKLDTPIPYMKPVRSQVRSSKPVKSFRTYDTELMINKNLLKKFDNDKIEHEFDEEDEELYQQLVHQPEGFYDRYERFTTAKNNSLQSILNSCKFLGMKRLVENLLKKKPSRESTLKCRKSLV